VIAGFTTFLWVRGRRSIVEQPPIKAPGAEQVTSSVSETPPPTSPTVSPALAPAVSSPAPNTPDTLGTPTPENNGPPDTHGGGIAFVPNLIIPVAGVRPDQLRDTFADARSEGRVHDAIDIPAPAGTQVLAAADGEIIKLFQSDRGGTTIYQLSTDKRLVYYYAHLQRYAEGLMAGKFARQGEVIGYVGDTGNAGAGNFHLHFSLAIIADPKRYWEGTNINPYPLLHK